MTRSMTFKTYRIVDGKPRKVIIDIYGDIIDNGPTDEELKQIKRYPGTRSRKIFELQEKERNIYLLEFMRYFYYQEGRVPFLIDFDSNKNYPSPKIYMKVFGSWNNAIREAGLKPRSRGGKNAKACTDEELLKFLIQFYEEKGRSPTIRDFNKNPKYPGHVTYTRRFGSWQKALKLVNLDMDSMTRRGVIETVQQKGRLGEIFVIEHFEEISIDLSGENSNSSCDGICPKGYGYDVKTAYFNYERSYWHFNLKNVNIDKIVWFYLLAFNEDFTEVLYVWRIPVLDLIGEIEKGRILIGLDNAYANNIKNLKKYEITENIKPMFEKRWKNLRRWTKEEILADARSKLIEIKKLHQI